jgi:hypothetical protein
MSAWLWSPCALVLVAVLGCSSEDGGESGPYAPPANGVAIGEAQACQTLQSAEASRRNALGCGPFTLAACPGYLNKGREPCSEYDQGTVQGCAAYISELEGCDAVASWKCVVQVIAGSAGQGC